MCHTAMTDMEAHRGDSSNTAEDLFYVRTLGLRDPQANDEAVAAVARPFKIPEARPLKVVRASDVVAKQAPHDKAVRLKKMLLKLGVHARMEKLTKKIVS